jgi:hypothetical protein
MMAMALLKNYHPFAGPKGLKLWDLFKKFDKTWALTKRSTTKYGRTSPERTYEDAMKRRAQDPWNFLFIAGMWFQDLFNYDFRRTEMCIIPYGTQQGEISFCAYNTGIGWRNIIENMHKNATVAEWYKNHGKHEIYAKGKKVSLESYEHSLNIDADDAARVRHIEHDIPVTAAEENRIRRRKALEEQAKVRAIYEELVLKKPQQAVVQIGTVSDIAKAVPANFTNAGKPVTMHQRRATVLRRPRPKKPPRRQLPATSSALHIRQAKRPRPRIGAVLHYCAVFSLRRETYQLGQT